MRRTDAVPDAMKLLSSERVDGIDLYFGLHERLEVSAVRDVNGVDEQVLDDELDSKIVELRAYDIVVELDHDVAVMSGFAPCHGAEQGGLHHALVAQGRCISTLPASFGPSHEDNLRLALANARDAAVPDLGQELRGVTSQYSIFTAESGT